ncbi:hypothetical protein EBU95_20810, partial [bacterium]|nr:hypothetical protein [bacterium]
VIKETKEAMRFLDIIFFIPATLNVKMENDGFRETDHQYQIEVDNIFKSLKFQFDKNYDSDVFFPKNDSPGLIAIAGTREQRLLQIGQYINTEGDLYGDEHSIFHPDHIEQLERLVQEQQDEIKLQKENQTLLKDNKIKI